MGTFLLPVGSIDVWAVLVPIWGCIPRGIQGQNVGKLLYGKVPANVEVTP